jgi:hypothetical protein
MTGWNLPPGCTYQMLDDAMGVDAICEVCGKYADDCICPECPVCGEHGNAACYASHNLTFTLDQQISRAERSVADAQDNLNAASEYLDWLRTRRPGDV